MRTSIVFALWLLLAHVAMAQSQPPFVYVIDYGGNHIANAAWFAAAAHCKPDVLHLGKDLPFTHNWGPIAGWGGENQWCGKTTEERAAYQRRLDPAEVREKLATITRMVNDLHQSGVREVMPYVCAMTVAGDWERRTGLWALYDHWDDYAEFGLGPKPAADPKDWLARKGDGSLLGYYGAPEKLYEPYGTERRCAACLYHPAWRQYMKAVVELAAKCGYDGLFVDNSCMFLCECESCQERFRQFLTPRYPPADRKRLLGSEDLQAVRLDAGDGTLLSAESKRFWCAGIADFMAFLRTAAQTVRPGFKVFPNAGAARWVEHAVYDCDLVMYELHGQSGMGSFPGVVRRQIVEDIGTETRIANEFEHKFTRAVGTRVRAVGLAMGGEDPAARSSPDSAWLPLAEACAYGGGGSASGLRMATDPAASAPAVAYREYLHTWHDLYDGYRPLAQVGIATFSEQGLFERLGWLSHSRHLVCARDVATRLADNHLTTDFIVRRQFTAERLNTFAAVLLCKAEYLDQSDIDAARAYAEQGGILVLVGDNGLVTLRAEKREMRPFADLESGQPLPGCGTAKVTSVGKGKVAFFRDAPRRDELATAILAMQPDKVPILAGEQTTAKRRVHLEVLARTSGSAPRLVVHAINYNVRLGQKPPPTDAIVGLKLALSVPQNRRVKAAWSVSPEALQRAEVAFTQQGATIECEIPAFRFYRVVALDLE